MTSGHISQVDEEFHEDIEASALTDPLASIEHLRKVQSVTDAALAHLTVEDLLDELLIRVRDALGADTAAILLLDREMNELVARAAKGIEEEVEQGVRIPVGKGFAGTIAATGKPLAILDVDHSIVVNPILGQKGIRSLLGVPLVVQGEILGVLHVGSFTTRRFTSEDVALLQVVSDRVALAIYVGLYEQERLIVRKLQLSLLPEQLPELPGLRLAARYLPARGGEVGGDWYDAFILPNGWLALVIGDVVGRGLDAAGAMARIRNALRAYALEFPSPGEVLARCDGLLQQLHPGEMVTALYGVVDPANLTFRFACAAHIPPVVRDPDGVRVINVQPGPPLGAALGGAFTEHQVMLRLGSQIVLCTDGLVERRGGSIDDGIQRLADACAEEALSQDRCHQLVQSLVEAESVDDDIAILVLDVAPDSGDQWQASIRSDARQLLPLRTALRRWLTERAIPAGTAYDVLVASGEATANAIEHAYGPSGGAIRIGAERSKDELIVSIRDFGRWRSPRVAQRGRGILMMRELADAVVIAPSGGGTNVELRWQLGDKE